MNRLLLRVAYLLLLAMLSIVVACSSSSDDVTPMLSISVDGIDLSGSALNFESAKSEKVDVNSNSLWRVRCNAAWVKLGPVEGNGKGSFMVSVDDAVVSRSAVVTISLVGKEQIRHSFDVIQRVSQTLPDEPNTEPNQPSEPENNPDDGQGTSPDEGGDDNDGDKDDENPDDGTTTSPEDPTSPEGGDPVPPTEEQGDYVLIDEMPELGEGRYHIGGYQNGVLHLATGGLTSVNHCKTDVFELSDDGTLVSDADAAEVVLEAAEVESGYYIRFAEDGYLTAKASGAGKLQFSVERSEYWIFSAHEEGGFVLRQSGDIDVKLIISQNAQSDVLRSISGDEDANAVIFLKINHPE